jgi:hypothetical protein
MSKNGDIWRAAIITVRRSICERFPPGRERDAWPAWDERTQAEGASRADWTASPAAPHHAHVRVPPHIKKLNDALGDSLVRACPCGASRHIEPKALARMSISGQRRKRSTCRGNAQGPITSNT